MVRSGKYGEYKFPGGGMEDGEEHLDTLIREAEEEGGLKIIKDYVQEFGKTFELRKDNFTENTYFEQVSYYYFCKIEKEIKAQNLDEYEKEYGYKLELTDIDSPIKANEEVLKLEEFPPWTFRELEVLRLLKKKYIED